MVACIHSSAASRRFAISADSSSDAIDFAVEFAMERLASEHGVLGVFGLNS